MRYQRGYAWRVARVGVLHPFEMLDRVSGRLQVRRERFLPRPVLASEATLKVGLGSLVSGALSNTWDEEFESVWAETERAMKRYGFGVGKGYDGGRSLCYGAYAMVRQDKPNVVVETGVARGVTSRVVLEAMRRNGSGFLYSIDLPPISQGWHAEWSVAVTDELRDRWTLIRGASRRKLPELLGRLGQISMFIHDGLHTYANMTWEMNLAWSYLQVGGLLLCDDVDDNCAFLDFANNVGQPFVVAQEDHRSGFVGAIRKI